MGNNIITSKIHTYGLKEKKKLHLYYAKTKLGGSSLTLRMYKRIFYIERMYNKRWNYFFVLTVVRLIGVLVWVHDKN